MATASGSLHNLSSFPEVTRGVVPASAAFQQKRIRSTTLALTKATLASQELRSDRQIADFRHGVRSGEGNVVTEVSYGSHEDWMASALGGVWTADVLKVGILRSSYSLLRRFTDIDVWQLFKAAEINTFQITVNPGTQVVATYGWMSDDMTQPASGAARPTTPTFPPYSTSEVLTGLAGTLQEGGATYAGCTEVTINLDNGMQNLNVIGLATAFDRSIGRSTVTGTASFYFQSADLANKFINETVSSLNVPIRDSLGTSGYDLLVPRIKYTGAPIPVTNEGPVLLTMPWQALLDPTTGTNLQITRVHP